MRKPKYSKRPNEYIVDIGKVSDIYENIPDIVEEVHEAFSPKQALGYVLKKNNLSFLYDTLVSDIDIIVKEKKYNKPDMFFKPETKKRPKWEQGELFETYDDF